MANDLVNDGKIVFAIEGAFVGQQLVEHHGYRKQVRARINFLALHLLGRHVLQGSHHAALGARRFVRILHACDAEIGQLDAPARFDQQVGRLHIAMHDALLVRIVKRGQQIANHFQRLLKRVAHALIKVVLEVVALDVLHDEERDIAVAVRIVDAHNIGMLQSCGRSRFGAKARFVLEGGFFGQVFHLDGLDRDPAVQVGVAALVNDSHGTLAKDAQKVIPPKLFQAHKQRPVTKVTMILARLEATLQHSPASVSRLTRRLSLK